MGEMGVVVGGDAVAKEYNFIAHCGMGDLGDVYGREVHGDAADNGCSLPVDDYPCAGFCVGA